MPRYIDADAVKRRIGLHSSIQRIIDSIPADDVRPKRHGHWEYSKNIYVHSCKCSACQSYFETDTPYCPKCGAKMDGKDGDSG